ncbi:periplasmic heavy metal sensor [Tropicimonas sp. S265A]|uniref:periplasmic heavy metal sensor n=1 Tax=Tropicimonas sp. S265A TaxID=3415134 RepID=UPI003C7BFAEE
MDPVETPPRTGWGRGRTLLFYGSLAANLLILGLVIGAVAFGGRTAPRGALDGQVPMLRALSDAEQRSFLREIRAGRPDRIERAGAAMRRARQMLNLLRADTFDAQAFEALMEQQSDGALRRAKAGRAALVEVVSAMDADARRAYATRLEQEFRKSVRDRRAPGGKSERPD